MRRPLRKESGLRADAGRLRPRAHGQSSRPLSSQPGTGARHGGTRRRVIVNIASINGKLGSPIVPYGTSKAGLIGLTRSLARTLAPYNIRVNAIAPGTIDTPMAAGVDPVQMERQMFNVAMERVGAPREIATVVRFLASDEASYMTGSIVDVAGGWMS
ncbi:SDR family oxidoreductase [Aquamicrobium sp. LC103]|nr:SDR family oxidoreductase [Aquamicrobium sp. LC103]